eukprot:2719923-Rhodomonas_salina.1
MESEARHQGESTELEEGEIQDEVQMEMALAMSSGGTPPSNLPSNVVVRHREPPSSKPTGSTLYVWLQGQLTEIMTDPTLPQTVRQDLIR